MAVPPDLSSDLGTIKVAAYALETVAHLRSLERELLPHADALRAMQKRMEDAATEVYQAGISPDTPDARALVTANLGWQFVHQHGDGVWDVMLPYPLTEGTDFASTVLGRDPKRINYDLEVEVSIEWP